MAPEVRRTANKDPINRIVERMSGRGKFMRQSVSSPRRPPLAHVRLWVS